jgi:hypothetical protein
MLTVSHFIKVYGNDVFRDGDIPWRMFWMLHQYSGAVMALERVNITNAVAIGTALAHGGDRVIRIAQQDQREAFDL